MGAGSPFQKEDPNLDHSEYDLDAQNWKYATEPNSAVVSRSTSLEREQRQREKEEKKDEQYGKTADKILPKVTARLRMVSEAKEDKTNVVEGGDGKGGRILEGNEVSEAKEDDTKVDEGDGKARMGTEGKEGASSS
ncbi:hypothetical protein BDZ45DRAFT_753681 [Acephala macrosclerotiorum]|nr:hypothetical protein BDZ45DRAFT_753681 [Acephala macrosclerotiorum]